MEADRICLNRDTAAINRYNKSLPGHDQRAFDDDCLVVKHASRFAARLQAAVVSIGTVREYLADCPQVETRSRVHQE